MERPHLHIHIGPHKTGSTYIQRMFIDNRDILFKNKIYYPLIQEGNDPGHSRLVELITSDRNEHLLTGYFNKVKRLAENNFDIILSSENLSLLAPNDLLRLRKLLPIKPAIYFFLRSGSNMFYSTWQEKVKHGETQSFSKFLFDHFSKPYQSTLIYPPIFLDKYANTFGKAVINIIDYDTIVDKGSDIFIELIQHMKLPFINVLTTGNIINKKISYELIETIRLLNCVSKRRNIHSMAELREWVLEMDKQEDERINLIKSELSKISEEINVPNSGNVIYTTRSTFIEKYAECIRNTAYDIKGNLTTYTTFKYIDDFTLLQDEAHIAANSLFDTYITTKLSIRAGGMQ